MHYNTPFIGEELLVVATKQSARLGIDKPIFGVALLTLGILAMVSFDTPT
ncbi:MULTISPECIES: hypothetical protein [unclassified Candidatus Tisiphia]